MRAKLDAIDFDLLINAAAFTNVDLCETQREQAYLINAEAPGVLAELCNAKDAKLIPLQHRLRFRWRETRILYRRRRSESDQRLRRIQAGRRKERARL